MTDAKRLLLDLLAVIPDGDKSAAFFAEDGVLELPSCRPATRATRQSRNSIITLAGRCIRISGSNRKTPKC
jgi:hypothetical protein